MEHPQGIIFDLDGVLLHSANIHREAFLEVFRDFPITDFDYSRYAGWRTLDVISSVLAPHNIDPQTLHQLSARKSAIARRRLAEHPPLDPDCGRILADLAADHHLALATSGSRPSAEAFLHASGSRSLFRSILCGDDVTRAKPDPEIYTRSIDQLALAPADVCVVEDAVSGVRAARAAGARVIALAGTCSEADLTAAGALLVQQSLRDIPAFFRDAPPPADPSRWTAVIPAAGRGSRLGFHRAKILFPVAGRLLLDWLLDILSPACERLVFVLSPDAREDVSTELDQRIPGRYAIAIQESPTGMGDAVALGLAHVRTPHTAVMWGDQVAVEPASLALCQRLHDGPLQPILTCPTVLRSSPYIHFERDPHGDLTRILQAREGDAMPAHGESDTGLFCFQTACVSALLRANETAIGAATKERNFLPVIPLAAAHGLVLTPRHMRTEETIGINSPADLPAVEAFLASRPRARRADGHES